MNDPGMSTKQRLVASSVENLFSEIERYLGVISLFRELGYEPTWRPEATSTLVAPVVTRAT